jgi:hypothetical protein
MESIKQLLDYCAMQEDAINSLPLLFHVSLLCFIGVKEVLCTVSSVNPGHVTWLPALIAAIHVPLTGNPAATWRYLIDCGIVGKLYMLFISSHFELPCVAEIVHNFLPLVLFPWRTGGSVAVMATVPSVWMVAPSSPGWKIMV